MAKLKTFNEKEILESYLEALLWVNEEEMSGLTIYDADEMVFENSRNDIGRFLKIIETTKGAVKEANTYSDVELGHNLLLSRNGHGAGFFDDNNDVLQDICRKFGSVDAYVGDDNKIYI